MAARTKKMNKSHGDDFMLKEYDWIHDLWMDENSQCEQRVSFFLIVATGAASALIYIFQSSTSPKENWYLASIGVLFVLFLFGITFLNRINARNVQVSMFTATLKDIQDYFAESDPAITTFLVKQRERYRGSKRRSHFASFMNQILGGSLMHVMVLSNGLICGGMVMLIGAASNLNTYDILLSTTVVTVGSIISLYAYSNYTRKRFTVWRYY